MKVYIEHEVSDDEKFCKGCVYQDYYKVCSLFRRFLMIDPNRTESGLVLVLKCEECLSAPKKVCRCAEKKSAKMIPVDSERNPIWPTC